MYKWKRRGMVILTSFFFLMSAKPVFAEDISHIDSVGEVEESGENEHQADGITEVEPDEKVEMADGTDLDESGEENNDAEMSDTNDISILEKNVDELEAGEVDVPILEYRVHVQNVGWQEWKKSGEMSGTTGKSLRIEALQIRLVDKNGELIENLHIEYRAHVQNIGWQPWCSDGQMAGTTGKSLRVEALQIRLSSEEETGYVVRYRTHVSNRGWQGFSGDEGFSGTTGMAQKLEAIEIWLKHRNDIISEDTISQEKSFVRGYNASELSCAAHIQNLGDVKNVSLGDVLGTTGRSLRVEGMTINMAPTSETVCGGDIEYSSHIQNIGWTDYVSSGSYSGTKGRALRMEAIKIRLTGELAQYYNVFYRVHAQSYGWLGWAMNGQAAGTAGCSYRLEAVQIKLVPKGSAAPGANSNYYKDKPSSASLISKIRAYKGCRYVRGGTTPNGWDCSGCTQWIYKNIYKIAFPRLTYQQAKMGKAVNSFNMNTWKPGDLLCFGNLSVTHVGIYLGNGEMLHALGTKYGTRIDNVKWYDAWDSGVRLLGVRRVI